MRVTKGSRLELHMCPVYVPSKAPHVLIITQEDVTKNSMDTKCLYPCFFFKKYCSYFQLSSVINFSILQFVVILMLRLLKVDVMMMMRRRTRRRRMA